MLIRCRSCGHKREKNIKYCWDCERWLNVEEFCSMFNNIKLMRYKKYKRYCKNCLRRQQFAVIQKVNKPLMVYFDGIKPKERDITGIMNLENN